MKLRSTVFLTLSLIVHAVCITALALSHFKSLESANGNNVEVTMGETGKGEEKVASVPQPEMKPIEKVETPKPLPKKEVLKPKKIVKAIVKAKPAKPATELPAKAVVATEEPESMNPKIDDADAVAVAKVEEPKEEKKEEAPEFTPVKEKVEASAADEPEDKTEASPVIPQEEPKTAAPAVPAPPKSGATEAKDTKTVAALGQGGESKSEAVSYLELRQFSGNKSPEYPLAARKEQRQGSVELLYRVTKDGRVAEVQINKSSGHPDLDESAVKAIAKFKFVPGQEGWAKHPVIFTLKGLATALPSKLRTGTKSAATE